MVDYKELANYFIDVMCSRVGVDETIEFLLLAGVDPVDMKDELNFDCADIARKVKELKRTKRLK